MKVKIRKEEVHGSVIMTAYYYLKNEYKSRLLQGNMGCEFTVD